MKVLVTGHKGFIGQNLTSYFMQQGHQVEGWEFMPNTIPDPSSYDWVVHLGAISDTTFSDVDQIIEQNYEYSLRLLQVCNTLGINFQYASSASVYGPTHHFTEDGLLFPQSPYAWSKYLFDRFVTQNLSEFDITVQGFRYFNVYGPYENHKKEQASPYTKFINQAKENKVIQIFENSENYFRDFICVEDVCKVHKKMMQTTSEGIYNIGTGNPVSFYAIAKAVASKYQVDIEYIPMPDNLKLQYQKYTNADLSKLNSIIDINWINIEDYINEY